jgi:hypothetical protein
MRNPTMRESLRREAERRRHDPGTEGGGPVDAGLAGPEPERHDPRSESHKRSVTWLLPLPWSSGTGEHGS